MSTDDDKLIEYVNFRQSTYFNYHRVNIEAQDNMIPQVMKFVQQDLPTSALGANDASNHDNESLLELCLRCRFS